MFGGLTGFANGSKTDVGEQMLNAAASQSIRHLFSKSDAVDVAVRCYPSSKLLQGSIDSFKMTGRGLVIRRQFAVEEMSFETDAVALDVGGIFAGQIRLRQPTQAVAQVVLSEKAINDAFTADLVEKRLKNVDLEVLTQLSGGEPVSFRDVVVTLLPGNRVAIAAKTDLPNRQDVPISMKATLMIEKRRRLRFGEAEFWDESVPAEVRSLSETLTMAFAEVLNEMVDLDRFDLDGVKLRLNRLEVEGKNLVLSGYAQIDHFPGIR
ncbi:MAG: DUF2993 domain-containing protein [Synechococcales cyanobacterium K44_A2020_017]|nr:DUF2993 domain-containing protein [Synechococcales cyanobacterium K32_A2020_035]MBF2095807.1 DUF2993 domain-containing protein [Synechococcales cyanobacterium K44_A2020_017]